MNHFIHYKQRAISSSKKIEVEEFLKKRYPSTLRTGVSIFLSLQYYTQKSTESSLLCGEDFACQPLFKSMHPVEKPLWSG
jgi:hypothetical protein